MVRLTRATIAGLVAGLFVQALAGCDNPVLRERWARREENLARTAKWLAELEADRQERLQRACDLLADQHQRDLANTRQIPALIQARHKQDVDRWQESLPRHRERFDEQMRGDLANIERTAPKFLD